MNPRRLAWLAIISLMLSIIWAGIQLRDRHGELASLKSGNTGNAALQLSSLNNRIDTQKAHISDLEQQALWESNFTSWITVQADEVSVNIIGVENLPVEHESDYASISLNITVRGDYNPLGRFINRLEHSPKSVEINSMRVYRREHTPQDVVMKLSISYLQRTERAL